MSFPTTDPLDTDDDATRVTIDAATLARLRRIEAAATRIVEIVEATTAAAAATQAQLGGAVPTLDRKAELHARKALCAAVRS